jgi:hypothetical protein
MSDSDINHIMNIQSANQRDKLTPSQQGNGYLAIAFWADEFKDFNAARFFCAVPCSNEV